MMKKNNTITELATQLGSLMLQRKLYCTVAESCTGGGLAAAITEIPGSSQWFDRGFVTYSNESKQEMLGVDEDLLLKEGAVSEATVRAMAEGAIAASCTNVSVAISGIAGPGGGSLDKPVGTVWIGWAGNWQPTYAERYFFEGDRTTIRQKTVQVALEGLIKRCQKDVLPTSGDRFFFALWPAEHTAECINARAFELRESLLTTSIPFKNLHMTLVYLGAVPSDFLQNAKRIAGQLRASSFMMQLKFANGGSHADVRWLGLDRVPSALKQLNAQLTKQLITVGFKPEKSPFVPHVTIERKYKKKPNRVPIEPVSWTVDDFYLVRSNVSAGSSQYDIVARWPLLSKKQ